MSQIDVWHRSGRRNPATGILISRDRPTIVFLTVCTLRRSATLARQIYHDALVQAWAEADAWLVGAYGMMPDHIHLFCAPKNEEIAIEQWIAFWKRQFRRKAGPAAPRFNRAAFIIGSAATRITITNGNMCEPILFEPGSLGTLKSGSIRVC